MDLASSAIPSPARPRAASPGGAGRLARWFYPMAGVVMLACVLVGFERFYFHGRSFPDREITPPIRSLVIAHGAAMAVWILLGLVQPALIATRKHKVHMTLGWAGAATAAVVLVLGLMVGVQSARVSPPDNMIMGFNPRQFMAVPVISVLAFAAFVAVGVWKRKKPAVHRAMMLSATLAAISAALNRIDPLNQLYIGTVWDRLFGPFFAAVVLALLLLAVRCVLIRGYDRWLATGVGLVILLSAFIVQLARTAAWDRVAGLLLGA